MSITITQILLQQGYITQEHYNYAYQVQQSQPIEVRQPLVQIYLEQGFLGPEHITYCLGLRTHYVQTGEMPDVQALQQPVIHQEEAVKEVVTMTCKVCLSDVQSDWDKCPFCGNPVG